MIIRTFAIVSEENDTASEVAGCTGVQIQTRKEFFDTWDQRVVENLKNSI